MENTSEHTYDSNFPNNTAEHTYDSNFPNNTAEHTYDSEIPLVEEVMPPVPQEQLVHQARIN